MQVANIMKITHPVIDVDLGLHIFQTPIYGILCINELISVANYHLELLPDSVIIKQNRKQDDRKQLTERN